MVSIIANVPPGLTMSMKYFLFASDKENDTMVSKHFIETSAWRSSDGMDLAGVPRLRIMGTLAASTSRLFPLFITCHRQDE